MHELTANNKTNHNYKPEILNWVHQKQQVVMFHVIVELLL